MRPGRAYNSRMATAAASARAPVTEGESYRGLMLEARRVVEGLHAGGHASPWRGVGHEFHEYRPFVAGDSRHIDWKVWGRTDRLYVKRFRLRTDLHVSLLVDHSASMHFAGLRPGGGAVTKLDYARTLAAAIAMVAIRQGDRAGLAALADRVTAHIPPGGAWAHLQRLIAALEAIRPAVGPVNVGQALRHAHALEKRRGLIVLISDLLDEPAALFDSLTRFRHDGFDTAVLQVLTPDEIDLAAAGDRRMKLVDLETRRSVSTATRAIGERYRDLMAAHVQTIRRGCAGLGADHVLIRTDEAPTAALRGWLALRGRAS
jgi:uncharacterized protein (DUF58 family)